MNRTFPALVLKIEYGATVFYFNRCKPADYLAVSEKSLCCEKHGYVSSLEDTCVFPQDAFVPVEVRRARVAIIPAEVVDEATRQKAF